MDWNRKSWKKVDQGRLEREDFDAGPTNLDEIEPGLWIGNLTAATDLEELAKIHCNYILTVDSCPLPRNISLLPGIKTMFIQVTDMNKEDLLSHFESAFEFIEEARENGVVLVHCYFGVSRSSTIVIAYLMKKFKISYDEAFERAKSKRKFVSPNAGFESQLRLYEKMGFTIDKTFLHYRLFKLNVAAAKVMQVKILPIEHMDVVKDDPALITVKPDPLVYRCIKCRRVVACVSNLLPHVRGRRMSWKKLEPSDSQEFCTLIYFIEPIAWMKSAMHSEQGKLNCPKCNSKLGSFSWTMGCQCPCGSKVSPAFYLVPSKVEWSNFVKNVQAI
ncbi:dual specificity protein phosphatase MPK-4-like isoform X2 [Cimex lectularius]|uniref:Protein-tyrosine-phosphatase n=1 Tax=Cimex lectularius TaxID=79782 RepID=A0A8I6RVH2_CIMLE|nr:dual specificity protein phosphatase MPK-4-like isoform X2 [Cimex lectularius]